MTKIEQNGVSYSYIKNDRFKTTLISVGFYLPLDKNAAANTLTLSLMKSETEKYPDTYSLNRYLAHLYGARVSSWVSKVGDCQELRIGITVNDDRFSPGSEKNVAAAGDLLCDMIFGKFFGNASFSPEAVERERRLLCETVAGKLNDKRTYARARCEELMCENEPYGLSAEGTLEEIKAVGNSEIRASLSRLIRNSKISVQVIGAAEPTEFCERLMSCLERADRDFKALPDDAVRPATADLKRVTEKMPVKQGKLVMGFRSENGGSDRDTVAAWIMGDIFGGGPYSKLFCNVREKMSLCYYCSARSVRRKGLIVVDSGVEEQNIEKTEAAVLSQLADMSSGSFTDTEVTSSKLAMCDMIRSVESDQAALARWYGARALEQSPASPSEICTLIESVTRDDIISAAAGFKLDTVYVLRPDGSVTESSKEAE